MAFTLTRVFGLGLVCLSLLLVSGCAEGPAPGEALVRGVITFQGKPLEGGVGSMNFVSEQAVDVARVEEGGIYSVTLPPGEYQISIRYKDGVDIRDEQGKMVRATDLIPKQFGDIKTSKLTLVAAEGVNEVNFDLP
ncbi:hypothetical protein [Blastopirellula marina]|uniref:Carboxypeptidase regulatory-like domain-containing protein n=1 Tax=Blastopirellula marina TaxID=124 RepID=A0A2S8GKS1_9BACT|nr:hypothetical protein [Blastopirellula marina]PQO45043.1 hypothetical protein C5Y93_16040 [Blastopirellula marina]